MAAETAVIVTNILSTGSFVGVAAYFATKWMAKVDKNTEQIESSRKEDAKALAADLRDTVAEHRTEIKEVTLKIEGHLDRIYEQLRVANGRTAKLEGGQMMIERVCAERHPK